MPQVARPHIDVREIPRSERHALIFGVFDELNPGQALELVNDHDPVGLRYQFEERHPGKFDWTYIDSGPDLWRVWIAKLSQTSPGNKDDAGDSCCSGGACCG